MRKQHKSINLINETHYLSKDLRKFFATVFKNFKKTNFDFKREEVTVKCEYGRGGSVSCRASQNSSNVLIKLPKEVALFNKSQNLRIANNKIGIFGEDSYKESFEDQVARAFVWTLEYSRGYNKEFDKLPTYLETDLKIGERKPVVKVKKTPDIKLSVLLKRKKNWQSKMKRCENAISKIEKQIKYYEKRLA